MDKQTEYIFEVLSKEMQKQNLRLFSLVNKNIISNGEYNYIKSCLKNAIDFAPKFDLIVRMCDTLNITPNDVIEGMRDDKEYFTPSEEETIDLVKDFSEEEVKQITILINMVLFGHKLKKMDKKHQKDD